MPWVETPSGEKKKVACGPCIRGHRSTTCQHKDRVLLEVRKPGRPLSSCPHPAGKCSCERFVVNYTIPSNTGCPCPSTEDGATPVVDVTTFVAPPTNTSNGVQKTKHKKSVSRNPAAIDKAIKAGDEGASQFQIRNVKSCCSSKPSAATPQTNVSTPGTSNGSDSSRFATPDTDPRHSPSSIGPSPRTARVGTAVEAGGRLGAASPLGILEHENTAAPAVRSTVQQTRQDANQGQGSCCGSETKPQALPSKSCCGSTAPIPTDSGQPSNTPSQPYYDVHGPLPKQGTAAVAPQYPDNNQFAYLNDYQAFGFATPMPNAAQSPYGMNGPFISNNMPYTNFAHPNNAAFTPVNMPGQLINGFPHQCTCGDACACLGCPVHPKNETTLNYVRDNVYFMANDGFASEPRFDMRPMHFNSSYAMPGPRAAMPIAQDPSHFAIGSPPFSTGNQQFHASAGPFQQGANGPLAWSPAPYSATPRESTAATEMPQSEQRRPSQQNPAQRESISTPQPSSASFDGDAIYSPPMFANGDQTPTLSPSSYLWQHLELPASCSDANGTCQCGPGCTCEGCLTHSGIGSQEQTGMTGLGTANMDFVANSTFQKPDPDCLHGHSPFNDVLNSPGPEPNSPVIRA